MDLAYLLNFFLHVCLESDFTSTTPRNEISPDSLWGLVPPHPSSHPLLSRNAGVYLRRRKTRRRRRRRDKEWERQRDGQTISISNTRTRERKVVDLPAKKVV